MTNWDDDYEREMAEWDDQHLAQQEVDEAQAAEEAQPVAADDDGIAEQDEEYFDDENEPYESWDLSDDGDALASAGFGTDEDYGGYGGEDW